MARPYWHSILLAARERGWQQPSPEFLSSEESPYYHSWLSENSRRFLGKPHDQSDPWSISVCSALLHTKGIVYPGIAAYEAQLRLEREIAMEATLKPIPNYTSTYAPIPMTAEQEEIARAVQQKAIEDHEESIANPESELLSLRKRNTAKLNKMREAKYAKEAREIQEAKKRMKKESAALRKQRASSTARTRFVAGPPPDLEEGDPLHGF